MPKRRVVRHEVIQPLDPSYKIIPLTHGKNTLVDTSDYDWLDQWNWYAVKDEHTGNFYAVRAVGHISMANEILQCKPGEEADHISHDTLDNRRQNLRKATHSQNVHNRRIQRHNTSGYIGVHWHKKNKKWIAMIAQNGTSAYLGSFLSCEDAARAYDEAAKKSYGEFAVLNFSSPPLT
jgi:hypothetical protein